MKTIKYTEAAEKIGRLIVKKFKADMKTARAVAVPVCNNFGIRIEGGKRYVEWDDDYCFIDPGREAFRALTMDIAKYVYNKIGTPRSWMWANEKEATWDGDSPCIRYIRVLKPCKSFVKATRKMGKLTGRTINPLKWKTERVSGKRSTIFSRRADYRCLDEELCAKLYELIKRRHYVSFEYKVVEDCEDREYGERYETEWNGTIYHDLVVHYDGRKAVF